ncbi:hypothetical protein KUTeg_000391 [Tegillarca granosa]|uniref:Prefoldin subunit 2 n=2 Tax=Tegillarca granosa TaxID=220873 RepID=A0ABQ9FXF6_TEGGR|nr:hypothetical protein KUTeg_000391 [Tegillarca granosa]
MMEQQIFAIVKKNKHSDIFNMATNKAPPVKKSQEQIIAGFQELRQQQRAIASKISELEIDMKEHDLVIETLQEVDGNRKCFRMVGGVLVERTVKDVSPALANNRDQIKGEESKEVDKQEKEVKAGGVLVES